MMDHDLPHVKTVKLLFVAMDEQQQAMFKMAFKMHNATNYEVITASSGDKPQMVIVDGDSPTGLAAWQKAKQYYANSVVVFFSKMPPTVTAPYLSKPIKFDSLFLSLRNLLQGNGVWVVRSSSATPRVVSTAANATSDVVHGSSEQHHQRERINEVTIPCFNPKQGLLGIVRNSVEQQRNTAILVDDKPVLVLFPALQRAWVAVDSDKLKQLCQQENVEFKLKQVPDESNIQERANVTIVSCLWQIALWTANGRLVHPITPNTVFRLKSWPNLTRLAPLPESMRLSAFLTKTSVSLNMLYKLMPLDMKDILNYIAVTYLTEHLAIVRQANETAVSHTPERVVVSAQPSSQKSKEGQATQSHANTARPAQKTGSLLSRFMRKLLNK